MQNVLNWLILAFSDDIKKRYIKLTQFANCYKLEAAEKPVIVHSGAYFIHLRIKTLPTWHLVQKWHLQASLKFASMVKIFGRRQVLTIRQNKNWAIYVWKSHGRFQEVNQKIKEAYLWNVQLYLFPPERRLKVEHSWVFQGDNCSKYIFQMVLEKIKPPKIAPMGWLSQKNNHKLGLNLKPEFNLKCAKACKFLQNVWIMEKYMRHSN